MFEILVRSASYYRRTVRCYDLPDFVMGLNVPVTKQCGVCSKYGGYFGKNFAGHGKIPLKPKKRESMETTHICYKIAKNPDIIKAMSLKQIKELDMLDRQIILSAAPELHNFLQERQKSHYLKKWAKKGLRKERLKMLLLRKLGLL